MKLLNYEDMREGYHYVFYEIDLESSVYKYLSIIELTAPYSGGSVLKVIERYQLYNDGHFRGKLNPTAEERHLRANDVDGVRRIVFELSVEEYYKHIIMEGI
jgi:hypothetical protein